MHSTSLDARLDGAAAVDRQHHAGEEPRGVRGQEERRVGDVRRLRKSVKWDAGNERRPSPLGVVLPQEVRQALLPFDTIDEAIALANDTEFGLAAYVYTSDLAKGLQVAEQIESGIVGLNRGAVSDPAAPFGGMKQSGLGREGSHHGLREFTETKYIAVNW